MLRLFAKDIREPGALFSKPRRTQACSRYYGIATMKVAIPGEKNAFACP
jgi:hypothetical protein